MFLSLLLLLLLHTVIAVVSVVAVVSAIAVVAFVTAVAVVVAVVHTFAVAAAGPLLPVLLWWLEVWVAAAACAVVFVFGSLVFTVVTVLVGLWVTRATVATVKWASRVSRELRRWGLRIFYLLPRSVGPKSSLRVKCFLPKSRRSQGIATHFARSAMLGISFRCGVKWSLSGDSCP